MEQNQKRLQVFISQPMKGKTNEEIEKERKELAEFAKLNKKGGFELL